MPLGDPHVLAVESNPLLPGSYLVRDCDNVHGDSTREETWYLLLPTHHGPYCLRHLGCDCAHTRAVEAWREEQRWPNGMPEGQKGDKDE